MESSWDSKIRGVAGQRQELVLGCPRLKMRSVFHVWLDLRLIKQKALGRSETLSRSFERIELLRGQFDLSCLSFEIFNSLEYMNLVICIGLSIKTANCYDFIVLFQLKSRNRHKILICRIEIVSEHATVVYGKTNSNMSIIMSHFISTEGNKAHVSTCY